MDKLKALKRKEVESNIIHLGLVVILGLSTDEVLLPMILKEIEFRNGQLKLKATTHADCITGAVVAYLKHESVPTLMLGRTVVCIRYDTLKENSISFIGLNNRLILKYVFNDY